MKNLYGSVICTLFSLSLASCETAPVIKNKALPPVNPKHRPPVIPKKPLSVSYDPKLRRQLSTFADVKARMQQLSLALTRYSRQHAGKMPDLSSPQAMQKALIPYLHQDPIGGRGIFVHPVTRIPFSPNPSLSYSDISKLSNPNSTCLLYESSLASDGSRGVVFVGGNFGIGYFKRVKESEWETIKKNSDIR